MMQDAGLFMAYEYGTAIGMPASEVLKLPVEEYTTGYMAYLARRSELIEEHASHHA